MNNATSHTINGNKAMEPSVFDFDSVRNSCYSNNININLQINYFSNGGSEGISKGQAPGES